MLGYPLPYHADGPGGGNGPPREIGFALQDMDCEWPFPDLVAISTY